MHNARAGKTESLAGQALETRPQGEVLAFDLLHRQLAYRVLLGWKMPQIDTHLVRVISGDPKGGEQGLEFQEHRIPPGTEDVGKYSPGVMIDCMPEPPFLLFGADETPHFIELSCALGSDAHR